MQRIVVGLKMKLSIALLFLAASAFAQDAPPAEIKADQFKAVVVKAGEKMTDARFRSRSAGLVPVPRELLADQKTAVYVPILPGKHLIEIWGVIEGKPTDIFECWLIVGKEPEPTPVPPEDLLFKQLTDAYSEDTGTALDKVGAKVKLIGLYLAMSDHVKKTTATTLKQVLADYREVAADMIDTKMLVAVRKVIAAEILLKLGSDPERKLDDEMRTKVSDLFSRFARLVGAIK